MATTTEILLGIHLVVAGATAFAASLRGAGFGGAAPYLAAAFGAAAWFAFLVGLPVVPHLLALGGAVVVGLAFLEGPA